jgi:capsular exopolysaccharide synthesis family protein
MSDDADRTIYDDFDPEAPETTEFRRILTRISRRGQKEKIRTLLVTSAERGEGKTTSAAMFAVVASLHQGFRTCLVDADLHRPRIAKLFDTDQDPGLAEILGDDLSIESALQWCRYDNLRIIPAGAKRPLPSELLIPDRLAAVFGKLKLLFDLIVIDAPPLLPVSDPAVLAREVDGVAMVVRAGRTQRDVAERAKKILDDAGANLLGAIVNNVDDVLPYYYGHTYYQYGEHAAEKPRPAEASSREPASRAERSPKVRKPRKKAASPGSSG